MNTKKILEDIIVDIANNVDISLYSSKLQIFARMLGNDNFLKWINQEYVYFPGFKCHLSLTPAKPLHGGECRIVCQALGLSYI